MTYDEICKQVEHWEDRTERQCFIAGATWAREQLQAENARMREALEEAVLQIEYLHEKFKETGSGNNVLSRIKTALEQ